MSLDLTNPQMVVKAAQRLKKLKQLECYDPNNLESRPTPDQDRVLKDINEIAHRYLTAGNQSIPGWSKVTMADGKMKPMEDVVEGDAVLCFDYKTHRLVPGFVTKKHNHGKKEVFRYWMGAGNWADRTDYHDMVVFHPTKQKSYAKIQAKDATYFLKGRCEFPINTAEVINKDIELLGFLLGDGCFSYCVGKDEKNRTRLQFTNTNKEIISYVESLIDSDYKLSSYCDNGDYFICKQAKGSAENRYMSWIRELGLGGKLAHDKFIPSCVFDANIATRLKFIAGLISTDGWITETNIGICTVSKTMAYQIEELLASLGFITRVTIKNHNNPNHRDLYSVQITNASCIARLASAVSVAGKPWKLKKAKNRNVSRFSVTDVTSLGIHEIYDITVSHPDSVYVCDGLLTGNSGKSQLGARETAWILTETHPYWKRPEKIGSDTLQLLVLGRVQKQIEEVLWRKISGFLNMDDLHLQRAGGALQSITYKPNGNKIIFLSHHSVSEAREKAQAYTADYVWIDELPGSVKLIEELHRRVMARDGRFLATFTPKVLNKEIRDLVDNSRAPVARKYQFAMLDNPIYTEAKKLEILESLETYPEAYRRTILYGDWYAGDSSVYHIPDTLIESPPDYHPSWRHVESSDPALSSKFGLTVWAESPDTQTWYLIRADYIKDIPDPNEMFKTVQDRLANVNLVKRIADPEANWYINIAKTGGVTYVSPNKVGRKGELIKNLQVAMTQGRIKAAPWCGDFIKELETCQWSETSVDNIVNASKFHLLDGAQYFVDMIPKPQKVIQRTSWQEELRAAHRDRKKQEAVKAQPTWRRQWKLRR